MTISDANSHRTRRRPVLTSKYGSLLFLMGLVSLTGRAQQPAQGVSIHDVQHDESTQRKWQFGGFVMGGFPPFYEVHTNPYRYHEELLFYGAAFEAGRMVTALHGSGPMRGRGEAVVEIIPFWLADHPAQTDILYSSNNPPSAAGFAAFVVHGVSVTPFLFRWNFMKSDASRWVPFAQLGSGLLWTSSKFPQNTGYVGGNTSRINFTPQVDFGESIFTRKRQSLNVGVRAVHMSSAGLGEYNPGINVSVQFTVGYSWWR